MALEFYYRFMSGLPGCLPDYNSGVRAFGGSRDFAAAIKAELDMLDYPQSAFAQIRFRSLMSKIRRARSASVAHRRIDHGGRVFELCGATEAEYLAESDDE